jgi:hypothetical protein
MTLPEVNKPTIIDIKDDDKKESPKNSKVWLWEWSVKLKRMNKNLNEIKKDTNTQLNKIQRNTNK